MSRMTEPEAEALALYMALTGTTGRLKSLRRIQYRCASHRCLMLDAIETPRGVLLHQKRYKYSPAENEARSNEDGRRANTEGGVLGAEAGLNKWLERTYFIGQSALAYPEDIPEPALEITCDHVLAYRLSAPEFERDITGDTREVRIRHDLSRYELD